MVGSHAAVIRLTGRTITMILRQQMFLGHLQPAPVLNQLRGVGITPYAEYRRNRSCHLLILAASRQHASGSMHPAGLRGEYP